jgi:hypothetical protein
MVGLEGDLLNLSHKRGGAKARLPLGLGYRSKDPQLLAAICGHSTWRST